MDHYFQTYVGPFIKACILWVMCMQLGLPQVPGFGTLRLPEIVGEGLGQPQISQGDLG